MRVTAERLRKVGKYEILGEIGQGAMGVVYQARDPVLERMVALKSMLGHALADPEAKERFLREARASARLQHPNVITIYELGEVGGVPYIAMEMLEGESLSDSIARDRFTALSDKLRVIEQLCSGLAYAHSNGVIHRDVKPSNVFILPDGTAKLLDFGIARLEGGTFATRTGVVLGTPTYMAPEQFTEDDVDHRVDMWATGVILYEMLTGKRPYEGASVPTLIYRIVHTEIPQIEDSLGLPPAILEILERALCKEPEDRYRDLATMGDAIRRAAGVGSQGASSGGGVATQEMSLPAVAAAASVRPDRPGTGSTKEMQSAVAGVRKPNSHPAAAAEAPLAEEEGLTAGSFRELGVFGERATLQVVAVAPGEGQVAIGGVDGSIRLWSLDKRMKLSTLRSRMHLRTGHAAMTSALTFSADGALLASGHQDGAIYLWQVATGLEYEARLRHEGAVRGLGFSPDNRLLVSAGMDAQVKLWELDAVLSGDARRQMRRQPDGCTSFAMASHGGLCITGHDNRTLRFHDPASGRLLATMHGHRMAPSVLAVSPACDLLLSGSRSGSIRLIRLDSRALLRQFHGHQKMVSSLAFFATGRHFVSVAKDHGMSVWDVASQEPITILWAEPDDCLASVAVLPGRRWLLCGLVDGRIRLWEY